MEIIEPSVELINPPKYEDLLTNIELAIRNCYKSEDKITEGSAEKIIKSCISRGHHSVLEFGNIMFRIIGDRTMMGQLTRHRIASYAIQSLRYCNLTKEKYGSSVKFVAPKGLDDRGYEVWRATCLLAETAYFDLIEKKLKPEVARSVLPLCTATDMVVSMNIRELRNVIALRTHPSAQLDIRDVFIKLRDVLIEKYPVFFEDLRDEV